MGLSRRLRLETAFQTHRPSLPLFDVDVGNAVRPVLRPDQAALPYTDEGTSTSTSDDDSSDGPYSEFARHCEPGRSLFGPPLASQLCAEKWHAIEEVQSRSTALLGAALANRLDELDLAQAAVARLISSWHVETQTDRADVLSHETRTLHALLLPRCAGSVRCGNMWLPVDPAPMPLERGLLLGLYAISLHAQYLNGLRTSGDTNRNQAIACAMERHAPQPADRVALELVHDAYVEAVAAHDTSAHSTVLALAQMHYWFVRTAADSALVNASVLSSTLFLFEALQEQAPGTTLAGPIVLPTGSTGPPTFGSPGALHHALLLETDNAPGAVGCFAHALSELYGRADAAAPLFEYAIDSADPVPPHPFVRAANARCLERLCTDVREIEREYVAASGEGRRLCADAVVLHAAFIRRGGDVDQVWLRAECSWPRAYAYLEHAWTA
jgi:hypothetical protein